MSKVIKLKHKDGVKMKVKQYKQTKSFLGKLTPHRLAVKFDNNNNKRQNVNVKL